MIPCNSEFRAYALVREIFFFVLFQNLSDECVRVTGNHAYVFHFSHFELYFALHSCVLSTFQQHLLQFPTMI